MAAAIHYILRAVPLTCFSLALGADIIYLQTSNLLWLHFSEWLLLVGVVFTGLALLALPIDLLIRRVRPSWLAVLAGVVVLVLAILNNLVHTADGWTAVMPMGVTLSAATVIAMIVTGIFGSRGEKHV
ncbi:DUF2231 domain-containing protein [Devosia sediminis]|uniref:DUF2231 domain-containing protein n=1 Tax=Devosia sediminis TaxID=2798801 RepID=A0A934IZJ8_9HYPH|nr:DUF2231 domain-containing protein [Devosia sediminis]MBJ3785995.1 hypothetical protein [Devosia sediminis]